MKCQFIGCDHDATHVLQFILREHPHHPPVTADISKVCVSHKNVTFEEAVSDESWSRFVTYLAENNMPPPNRKYCDVRSITIEKAEKLKAAKI